MNNTIQTAASSAPVAKAEPVQGLNSLIKQMAPAIKAALPSAITPERFTRIVLSAISSNPVLQACTPKSFLSAMMTSAQLGMEANTPLGQAYLIPYNNHGVTECQFQLGYRGLIELAYRSGKVASISAETVYANDQFEYELGLETKLRHVPSDGDRGEPTHYYAVWRTKDGITGFAVMSVSDIRKHAERFSKAKDRGPWATNFDEMAKKTVLKKALKYAPLSSDFQRGVAQDFSIRDDIADEMALVPPKTIDAEPLATEP